MADRPIVDWGAAASLGNGYRVAQCVASDGESWPWLVANLCPDCEDAAAHGPRADVPAHERTGRFPREVRDALGLVYRCGAPTRQGAGPPCPMVVVEPGTQCGIHRDAARAAGTR